MAWSKRTPERDYALVMWVVSLVLTGFLIGLGNLVIGDLPRVEKPVTINQFVNKSAARAINAETDAANDRLTIIEADLRVAQDDLQTERGNYQAAYESYQNWLATRRATTDPAQDPEVIARTNALDILKERERAAERQVEATQRLQTAVNAELSELKTRKRVLKMDAQPEYRRAHSNQELRVFLFRLALTLPLLLVAFWMVARKRESRYWPLMRGFVIFAGFAFFVELVPYLPSYGGYVRYGVGVVLTLLAGHYIIKWMRTYLTNRQEAERQSEGQRRKSLAYEDALKKVADDTCPGCDRKVLTTDEAVADYCVHCGMHLYDNCTNCDTRKVSFYRYCMVCGVQGAAPSQA